MANVDIKKKLPVCTLAIRKGYIKIKYKQFIYIGMGLCFYAAIGSEI